MSPKLGSGNIEFVLGIPPGFTAPARQLRNIGLADINPSARVWDSRQPAVEMWRRTLERIPSVFGRLACLAALRDRSHGRYFHPALTQALGEEEADRTLRRSHHQVFSQWLSFSLPEQKLDLDEFLDDPKSWRGAADYRSLPPAGAREVELQLFFTDLETLLDLLGTERGDAFPIPRA